MKNKTNSIVKFIFIGVVIGILLILNACIGGKLSERERTHNSAVNEISQAAGGFFSINDVYIAIPYTFTKVSKNDKGVEEIIVDNGTIYYQPKKVDYNVEIKTQMRNIGIYEAPIFTGDIDMNAEFYINLPKNGGGYEYNYKKSYLRVKINDRLVMSQPTFTINGKKYGTEYSGSSYDKSGITAYFNCDTDKINFSTTLRIRGAEIFSIKLASTETHMKVNSDWVSPGFSKFDYLPVTHEITDKGFTAEWNIPFDGGDSTHSIGFNYIQPINIYKMLDRAVNYGFLFILVPFIVLFLFEIFASINLHPLHYLLSGAASVIFFLLLMSFSEHINFGSSYIISAVASGVLVSLYVASITKKYRLGFTMSLVFAMMYGYLFMSLKSEDYALLIGSLFAFIILAAVMFLTRKVDWNNLKKEKNTLVTNE